MGKLLALDFGAKRVGYAVSDPDCTVAFPRSAIQNPGTPEFNKKLSEIVKEEGVTKIIVGLSTSEEAEEGTSAKRARTFGESIGAFLKLPVEYIDESNTTEEALAKIPFRKDRREKENVDAIAAQVILIRYLESKCQRSNVKGQMS